MEDHPDVFLNIIICCFLLENPTGVIRLKLEAFMPLLRVFFIPFHQSI